MIGEKAKESNGGINMKRKREKLKWRIVRFILRPFAGPIRYGALKIMKKLRVPGDRRPMIAASDYVLNMIVLPSVFQTFQEEKFRELARFKKLPVSEHDRIFNELQVAGVCLAIFYLRAVKSLRLDEYRFWHETEESLPKQLQRMLMDYGVASSNAKLMRQLIDMRRGEYEEIAEKELEVTNFYKPEFRDSPPEIKQLGASIQATAVGATNHIRRGKMEDEDPLIRYLIDWLLLLQRKIAGFVQKL